MCSQTLRAAIRTTIGSVIEFKEPLTDDFGPLNDNKAATIGMIFLVGLLALMGIIGVVV